jgi:23S rRNA (cytosine1962-C5)-methyltransferase
LTAEKIPTVIARSPSRHPYFFRKMLASGLKAAQPGDLVRVVLEESQQTLGYGLYNPRAEMAVRTLTRGDVIPDEAWWKAQLGAAVRFRKETLGLDQQGDAYRLIHAEGDGLPGLMVDLYGDVLSVEAFSLGMYQRAESILDILVSLTKAKHGILRPGPYAAHLEGFDADPFGSENAPESVVITENGVKYEVRFEEGHKTGFFCDQRNNRTRIAEMAAGQRVLDLCCYTGGFALAAAVGGATQVQGVDLDEDAIAVAKKNAKLNGVEIQWAHADIFAWMREAQKTGQQWDLVILDPPKLIRTREDYEEGRKKYFDMNRLAASLVAPGGMLVTCSCSGLLSPADFTRVSGYAIDNAGRSARLCEQTGAGPDHPVHVRCPESLYLKVNWFWFDEAPTTPAASRSARVEVEDYSEQLKAMGIED